MKVKRFNLIFRIQHILMFTSVILLILSGALMSYFRHFNLNFLNSIINFLGGIERIRNFHHFFGYVLTFSFIYLLIYIFIHPEGRRDFLLFLPTKKDFLDFYQNILFYLGKRKEKPKFGRFTYWEKFDFWAAFWGCLIMIGSGLLMLYPEKFKNPGYIFEVSIEAHYHEAILAAIALLIWHMYNVHLKHKKFFKNLVWFNGKIRIEEKEEEHPFEEREMEIFYERDKI